MSKKNQDNQSDEQRERKLPTGVKLKQTLLGHTNLIKRIAWSHDGEVLASGSIDRTLRLWDAKTGELLHVVEKGDPFGVNSIAFSSTQMLASGGGDKNIKLWDANTGELLRTLEGRQGEIWSVAFNPQGNMLASGGDGKSIKLWDANSGKLLHTLEVYQGGIWSVAFNPQGNMLASGGADRTIKLWDVLSGKLIRTLEGHQGGIWSVVFDPVGDVLASGSGDKTIKLWDAKTGKLIRTLEGHTMNVNSMAFSAEGELLISKDAGVSVRFWRYKTGDPVAVIPEEGTDILTTGLSFHPELPLLASVGSVSRNEPDTLIHIWELDLDLLLGKTSKAKTQPQAVHHTTAKIVLVGDSGVGKTGLGWRLAHGDFKEHSSTHGQQFWVLNQLSARRDDGTECEAILWDLAGQPDYRLTHALFIDDADLALLLFDPTDSRDPLHGVEFWLKQLKAGQASSASGQEATPGEKQNVCPTILVGGRADRGEARLTQEELDEFCRERGISGGYLSTSAKENIGLDDLLRLMKEQIPWEHKSATVTTVTFKRIKDYVLGLKENPRIRKVIVSPQDLRKRLEKTNKRWKFTDAEMMTAVGHLANYGYVRVLRTSKGEERILLVPELLNNLAASFVLEARRNSKGLGSLEEKRLLAGEYLFRELEKLSEEERGTLLDSAALLFLKHNVCFRETDPLGGKSYLVFPELINLKKPVLADEQQTEDGVS